MRIDLSIENGQNGVIDGALCPFSEEFLLQALQWKQATAGLSMGDVVKMALAEVARELFVDNSNKVYARTLAGKTTPEETAILLKIASDQRAEEAAGT